MAKSIHFLIPDITTSQNLASAALSYTTDLTTPFKLEEVILRASVAITETVTITRDSVNGANYDHVLASKVLSAEQNFVFRPSGECNFQAGDKLKVQCTNANVTGVVYMIIKLSDM